MPAWGAVGPFGRGSGTGPRDRADTAARPPVGSGGTGRVREGSGDGGDDGDADSCCDYLYCRREVTVRPGRNVDYE